MGGFNWASSSRLDREAMAAVEIDSRVYWLLLKLMVSFNSERWNALKVAEVEEVRPTRLAKPPAIGYDVSESQLIGHPPKCQRVLTFWSRY